MPRDSRGGPGAAEELAKACVGSRQELRRAAQVLHDDVGPLVAVAGLRLQLLCMDFPAAAARVSEVSEALDGVMSHLRVLSRRLEPSPVRRTGLKNALLDLIRAYIVSANGASIRLRYTATAMLPPETADAIYHAIEGAIAAASPDSRRMEITVSGSRSVAARVSYQGRARKKSLATAALLARHSGLSFEVATEKSTIVSIRYAIRRASRG